jgi:hypothetical protein
VSDSTPQRVLRDNAYGSTAQTTTLGSCHRTIRAGLPCCTCAYGLRNTATINTFVRVRPRLHDIDVQLLHAAPALVGEQYPITIQVRNNDSRIFAIVGDFLLQPAENDTGKLTPQTLPWSDWLCIVNTIAVDDEQSSGLIKGIEFGTIHPGEKSTKVLYLSMSGAAGPRIIDISIQSRIGTAGITQSDNEVLKTVTVQGLLAFSWETDVTYCHPVDSPAPWLDLSQVAERHRVVAEAVVSVKLKLESPWDVVVQSIRLVENVCVVYSINLLELTHDRALLEAEFGTLLVKKAPRIWAVGST